MHKSALAQLNAFPYLKNYLQLAAIEREALGLHSASKVVFIGGGPMPLTAIALALLENAAAHGVLNEFTQSFLSSLNTPSCELTEEMLEKFNQPSDSATFHIDAIDIVPEVSASAAKLIEKLGLSRLVSAHCADGAHLILADDVDTVMIASMAEPKLEIMINLAKQRYQNKVLKILVRSVEKDNLRRLLYEPVDETLVATILAQFPGATCNSEFTPPPGSPLINSFLIFSIPADNQK